MGCGLACVAYLAKRSYRAALASVEKPERAWTRGFYCPELVALLQSFGLKYGWKAKRGRAAGFVEGDILIGSIVFLGPCKEYPQGHFMVKVGSGLYMNPWLNFPSIRAAKAGFTRRMIGSITHVIFPLE